MLSGVGESSRVLAGLNEITIESQRHIKPKLAEAIPKPQTLNPKP